MKEHAILILLALSYVHLVWGEPSMAADKGEPMTTTLNLWERGVAVHSATEEDVAMYLWFYEWHLFDAVEKGEHTRGSFDWSWTISEDHREASMDSEWLGLKARATEDGADLTLAIANTSDHDWPEIAAIIPCFNPGPKEQAPAAFRDTHRQHTYYVGTRGLEALEAREIHFNHDCVAQVENWPKERDDGQFVFSHKWPTSKDLAQAGLIVRESEDGEWVMGIAWDSFLSAQGHNPWKCMHLSIKVGPLKRGETKTIRGKIYLFPGTREDCLVRFQQDF